MPQKIEMRDIQPFCSIDDCNNDGVHKQFGIWFCTAHAFPSSKPSPFDSFISEVRTLVEGRAAEKGYNDKGAGDNKLMELTSHFFPGHASGEVVYKLIRYQAKGNPEDLAKAAAWIFLIWQTSRNPGGPKA